MKTNRENFLALVSDEKDTYTLEKNDWRIANRQWLRVSYDIAFDILEKLDDLGWTQKEKDKLDWVKTYLKRNHVFDNDSFYELINENYEDK